MVLLLDVYNFSFVILAILKMNVICWTDLQIIALLERVKLHKRAVFVLKHSRVASPRS